MRTLIRMLIGFAAGAAIQLQAETVTLTVTAADGATNVSAVVTLSSNDFAEILHAKLESNNGSEADNTYSRLLVGVDGSTFRYTTASFTNPAIGHPVIAGPATLQLSAYIPAGANSVKALCTIRVTRSGDDFRQSTAVVIPADTNGPVNIILESSVDLVTWTPAMPGSYGTSTQKRFFRVRATR